MNLRAGRPVHSCQSQNRPYIFGRVHVIVAGRPERHINVYTDLFVVLTEHCVCVLFVLWAAVVISAAPASLDSVALARHRVLISYSTRECIVIARPCAVRTTAAFPSVGVGVKRLCIDLIIVFVPTFIS